MKNNLYKEFNCNSKEELYEKIKRQDEEIKPLIEFLDFARADIQNNKQAINGPDIFVDYVKSTTLPTKDTGTIIFANTKHHPVHLKRTRLSWKNSMKEALKEGLVAGANRVFLAFSNETPNERIEETKEYFEKIGMKIIDTIDYNKENNSFLSKVAGRSYYPTKTYEMANDSEVVYGEEDYSLKNKYVDFTSYFASNELIDLNVVENIEEIKETLKIGFQHHQQEIFGILVYDSNEKIIGVEELFKGSTDASIVDLKIMARSLLNYQDVKGLAVFHNHPSGNPTPSNEDIEMTRRVENMTEIFEIELLDHFIVGREKTLSFSQEVSGFQSDNIRYQDKLEKISTVNEDKGIYEGDYSDSYPQKENRQIVDSINKMINDDYEGFVKALITIENGVEDIDLLDELYEKFMNNDGVSLINDYFEELIYDLEYNPVPGKEKDIEPAERANEYSELFSKMDSFVNAYTELSNAMYNIDYDFAEDYPLDKSFHEIDFISWAEASKLNISEENKEKSFEKTNAIKDKKDNKKESTIEKLNKLKDKVSKDNRDKVQEKVGDKKNDKEL